LSHLAFRLTTEDPDRTREVVRARGMNDSQFKLNPLVTLQHAHSLPPIGRSLWRKVVRDGPMQGVKAKTQYPVKPEGWQGSWPADVALCLVQADLLRGKSIGFLPTKVHSPSEMERQTNGWKAVDLVIDEWILLEYACTFLKDKPKKNGSEHLGMETVGVSFRRALAWSAAFTEWGRCRQVFREELFGKPIYRELQDSS